MDAFEWYFRPSLLTFAKATQFLQRVESELYALSFSLGSSEFDVVEIFKTEPQDFDVGLLVF